MPYPDLLVLSAGREVLSVRTEADTANVKVTILVDVLILERGHILAGAHVEDLRRAIAARRQILAIATETNAAHDAVVDQVVHQLHVEHARHFGVKYGKPIGTLTLLSRGQIIEVPVRQHVTGPLAHQRLARRRRAGNLRRGTGVRIGKLVRLLGGCRSRGCAAATLTRARRCGGRGGGP